MIFVSWNSADYPVYLVITYFQQINLLPSQNSANFIKYEELDYPLKTFVIITCFFLKTWIVLNLLKKRFLLLKSQLVAVSYKLADQQVVSYKGVSYKTRLCVHT